MKIFLFFRQPSPPKKNNFSDERVRNVMKKKKDMQGKDKNKISRLQK
jgi:hypothetical protein